MPGRKGLSDLQIRFAHEYLKDLNAAHAAVRAGYAKKSAKVLGFKCLQNPKIQEIISKANQRVLDDAELDAKYVLLATKEILVRCMQREQVMEKDQHGDLVPTGEWKFDSAGACKAVKLLGDHIAINAYKGTDGDGNPIDLNWTVTFVDATPNDTKKT